MTEQDTSYSSAEPITFENPNDRPIYPQPLVPHKKSSWRNGILLAVVVIVVVVLAVLLSPKPAETEHYA